MTLGLSEEGIQRLFNEEYEKNMNKRVVPYESLRGGYELQGIPENIAKEIANLAIRQMAACDALKSVIKVNNGQIESQLRARGVAF